MPLTPCPACHEPMLLPVRTADGGLLRWCTWCHVVRNRQTGASHA